uniref:Uncharacterized protein n=1 Tax=Anopheles minimus TaxID=112268 RepID=A0A182WP99_9DIPT
MLVFHKDKAKLIKAKERTYESFIQPPVVRPLTVICYVKQNKKKTNKRKEKKTTRDGLYYQ